MSVLQMRITETFTGMRINDEFQPYMSDSWNDYAAPDA
jgi:hypothetical protein